MFTFLVILISVLALMLIFIVLLQAGKGGGLAASFGGASSSTESFIGGRQAATLLTKLTWIGGGVFLFLALVLSILSSRSSQAPESILRGQFGPGGAAPETPASVLQSEVEGPGEAAVGGEGAGEVAPGGSDDAAAGDEEGSGG